MKLFIAKFYQTLVLNVATIAAIVVGIVQFAVRSFNENNGAEKTRKVIQTVLVFINTNTERLMVQLTEPTVPVVKVAQKTTKRRWDLLYYIHTWETQMTQFQTIVIGEDDNGFYNEPTLHSSQRAADKWGRDMLVGASV